jgi:hypothetical protein
MFCSEVKGNCLESYRVITVVVFLLLACIL